MFCLLTLSDLKLKMHLDSHLYEKEIAMVQVLNLGGHHMR